MMNKLTLLVIATLCTPLSLSAQQTAMLSGEGEYRHDDLMQLWRHTANSAAMATDSARARGMVEMDLSRHEGSYHRVQEGSACNSLSFSTERYQAIGRYLYGYGHFEFNKGRIQDRAWSDVMRTYESNPFISGSSVPGRYDFQNFGFTARVGTIELSHWRLGLALDYNVGDLSRLRDPRSRNRLLDYKITPAVAYTLGAHTIGMSGYYNRRKEKMPSLTTVQDNPDLYYYQMSGLDAISGTVGGYNGFAREYVGHTFGAELAYGYQGGGFKSVNAISIARQEEGIYEQYKREPGRYYVYTYGLQSLNRIHGQHITHQIDLQAQYTQGYADEYRPQLVITTNPTTGFNSYRYDNLLTYRKRYQMEQYVYALHYRANLRRAQAIKRYVGMTLLMQHTTQRHLLPSSSLERCTLWADAEYGQGLLKNNALWITANLGYHVAQKANLALTNPETLYSREVLLADMTYYDANYARGSISIKYQWPMTIKGCRSLWYVKAYAETIRAQHSLNANTFGLTLGLFN